MEVKISEKKTVGMMLKEKFVKNRCPVVRVSGKMLMFVSEVRYLNVRMSEIGFVVHVKGLYGRVVNTLSGLRRVMRREWGLRVRTVRMIIKDC